MFKLRESVEASKAVIITVVNCPKNLMVLIFSQNLCGPKVAQFFLAINCNYLNVASKFFQP